MAREYTTEERVKWLKGLPKTPAGAAVALENPDGQLLIVKASYKRYWTAPGGVIDENESPKQAAIREVAEEVSLELDPSTVRFRSISYNPSTVIDVYLFIFAATISAEMASAIALRDSEIEEWAFVSKEEVLRGERLYAHHILQWANDDTRHYIEEAEAPMPE